MQTSVIIAARSGTAVLGSALDSLSVLPEFGELEVVVASSCGASADRQIAQRYPGVTVVSLPEAAGIAELRREAMRRASGQIVVVLNERYRVPPNWIGCIRRAHEADSAAVVAGCVGPSPGLPAAQWAMFLTEYMHAAPPLPTGVLRRDEAVMVPGGNVSYKRSCLPNAVNAYTSELDFHACLLDRGARFYRDAGILVECGHYAVSEYLAERLEVSRGLAARRAAGLSAMGRIGAATLRLALPALVVLRIARAVFRRKIPMARFVRALPWIAAFAVVQAWGEIRGFGASSHPVAAARRAAS